MRIAAMWCTAILAAGSLGGMSPAWAQSHFPDQVFRSGFEALSGTPTSDADAARFLAQASFGATDAEIAHLRVVGYDGWLNEQFAAPASQQAPYLDWVMQLVCPGDDEYCNVVAEWTGTRAEIWAINALGTPDPSRNGALPTDQLRQRVAFALSEIFVVSNSNGTLAGQPWALASYYDMLVDDAFGNYRTLLEDVTKHPAMGVFLSSIQNQKADAEANIHPDENYAREINQLFSIGLVQLNLDGTPKLSGGQPIPTYGQATVRGFAAVFTGWNFNSFGCSVEYQDGVPLCCNNPDNEYQYFWCGPGEAEDPEWQLPMEPVEIWHDNTSSKQLLDYPGVALAGGVLPPNSAQAELTQALDNIFHHPNVGPFIGKQLIQRLVTSNPSPAYVQRVAQVFNDDGSAAHVRGNLRAVVRAILLDPEARVGHWQRYSSYGKLREPLLKLTQIWRALHARTLQGDPIRSNRISSLNTWPPLVDMIGQSPLQSPTVFNFFKPDFAPSGEMRGAGLVGPEFQILTDTTTTSLANTLFWEIFCNHVGNESCWGSDDPSVLLMNQNADAVIAEGDPAALVDRYNLLLMSGQMSPFMRNVLVTRLNQMLPADYDNLGLARVHEVLYLILTSPEYSIQK
ncbi:DUF1800 domain-containing protein [Dokdonella sp.]|uniref:DUF1800 domain-containing protein n=1 Tax=Dokdonella sp. TaxID=2291710 RepID=UPI0025BCF21F|nr:DUF1800 domain-containing protein [Dokdonella sp.]MBX3690104.1 DUF1800 domain-containing protein [Dokdonella sp.]